MNKKYSEELQKKIKELEKQLKKIDVTVDITSKQCYIDGNRYNRNDYIEKFINIRG